MREEPKKAALVRRVEAATGHVVTTISLGVGRATVYRAARPRTHRYAKREDRVLLAQLRDILHERASYEYRRATALVNHTFGTHYNHKRVRRVLQLQGWTLPRCTTPRSGRAHAGSVTRDASNERWCSDSLHIACWNGEVVKVACALDCGDRECFTVVGQARALSGADLRALVHAAMAARSAERLPSQPVQWLSDNARMHTALETIICAERLGLASITTPA